MRMSGDAAMTTAEPIYRERLLPRLRTALLLLCGPAVLGIAYGAAIGALAGWLVFAASSLAAGVIVLVTTPSVAVSQAGLSAGRAFLPSAAIGAAVPLDSDARRHALATHATAFTMLRTWAAPTAVLVHVKDPQDPHPVWVISSRYPDRLVTALHTLTAREDPP